MIPLLALLGCHSGDPFCPDDQVRGADGECHDIDQGLLPDGGCVEDPDAFVKLDVRGTAVPMVSVVEWETDAISEGYLSFSTDDLSVQTPRDEAGRVHAAYVLGVPADTELRFRVVSTDADGTRCSTERWLVTGSLPADLPELTVSSVDVERASGAYVPVSLLAKDARQVNTAILDGQGRYVWFTPQLEFHYRVMIAHDRGSILSNTQASAVDQPGLIERTGWGGDTLGVVEVDGAHTDFVELPDGTLTTLAWDLREFDHEGQTRQIMGDRIIEVGPDGAQRELWSVFDEAQPDLDQRYDSGGYEADPDVEDWSHANSISYDVEHDAYLVTFFRFEAVARVDRQTGAVAWLMSQDYGDITTTDGDYPVSNPHSARAMGDGSVLVLNRGWFDPGECSEAVQIAVDADAGTATTTWSYETDTCLQNVALGEAHELDNGNILVDWSFSGQLDEVTPEGDVVWRVNTALGEAFGFTGPVQSLYPR